MTWKQSFRRQREYHTLLELNNNSLNPRCTRQNARENDMEMLRLCKKYRVPIVMGSDAHYYEDILNHELALDVIKETGFPERTGGQYRPGEAVSIYQ